MKEAITAIPAEAGELRAITYRPDRNGRLPGVVLVDGAKAPPMAGIGGR
jgi:dienelactone hydrolase